MDATAVLLFVMVVFLFWISIWVPATMAAERGRSVLGWLLLTLFFSPMVTIIAILVLGPTIEKVLERLNRKSPRHEACRAVSASFLPKKIRNALADRFPPYLIEKDKTA